MDLVELYQNLAEVSKHNPIVAGAVSLWGLGVATYLVRNVPSRIYRVLLRQSTTQVTINNTGYWGNKEIFWSFSAWFASCKLSKLSRNLAADAANAKFGSILGPGAGLHFFIYQSRLFWFIKSSIKNGNSVGDSVVQEEVVISTFGRSRKPLESLLQAFKPKEEYSDKVAVFSQDPTGWYRSALIPKRSLDSVIVNPEVKSKLSKSLDEFYGMRDWYIQHGVAHKLVCCVYGVPGTGKTSLIKALAAHYDKDVYVLNLNELSNTGLRRALNSVVAGSFVLMEDFDSASAVMARTSTTQSSVPGAPTSSPKNVPGQADLLLAELSGLDLSTVLNSLDGITALDNVVIFMTTNHIEKIDSALLRNGRTDLQIELRALETAEVHAYVKRVYGKTISDKFQPVVGCDLHALLLEHKENFDGFYKDLLATHSEQSLLLVSSR